MRHSDYLNADFDVAFANHCERSVAHGVDGLRNRCSLRMRLCTRRAGESMACYARGKRCAKPRIPGAIGGLLPSLVVPGSQRSWHRQRHGQPGTSTCIT